MGSYLSMFAIRRPRLMPLITAALILALIRLARNRRRRRLLHESKLPMERLKTDMPLTRAVDHEVAKTTSGPVKGFRAQGRNVLSFRAVPYAAPPTGALRFKRPEDHEGWGEEVRDCTRFGPCAPQDNFTNMSRMVSPTWKFVGSLVFETVFGYFGDKDWKQPPPLDSSMSEDCLTLDVYTPALTGSRPVAVFIHGGAFELGSSSAAMYNQTYGHPLADTSDTVVVQVQYRLGVLGFLKVDGGDYNNGIRDQIHALKWVKDNISNFGGDPNNVTIFGQSAGGMSCGVLLASPLAEPYFHRAVCQSGAASNAVRLETCTRRSAAFAKIIGIEPSALTSAALADVTAAQLVTVQKVMVGSGKVLFLPFQPVVDGEVLLLDPLEAIENGSAKHKDILVGYTSDEWQLFIHRLDPLLQLCMTRNMVKTALTKTLGPTLWPSLKDADKDVDAMLEKYRSDLQQYKGQANPSWASVCEAVINDILFQSPALLLAEAHKRSTAWDAGAGPEDVLELGRTFMYRFEFESDHGAIHALELPFVHGTILSDVHPEMLAKFTVSHPTTGKVGTPSSERMQHGLALSEVMMRAWTTFFATGVPEMRAPSTSDSGDEEEKNGKCVMDFPEFSVNNHEMMVFDYPECRVDRFAGKADAVQATSELRRKHSHGFGIRRFHQRVARESDSK